MNHDLKQQILQMFKRIDSSDWTKLQDHFHANVEYRRPGYDTIRGLGELLEFYANKRIVKSGEHRLESIFYGPGGASLSVTGSFKGSDRQGHPLDVRFCDVYVFESDKIIERETFFSAPAV